MRFSPLSPAPATSTPSANRVAAASASATSFAQRATSANVNTAVVTADDSAAFTPWLLHPLAAVLRIAGAGLLLLALGMMWSARIIFDGNSYVSGLGAHSEITAVAFNISLGMVALGGALCAAGLWGRRAEHRAGRTGGRRLLAAWSASVSLLGASALFAVGATVPCSTGCPIPLSDGAQLQDLVHTTAAVLGFAFAGVAILQTLRWGRAFRLLAAPSMVLVIVASATGGLLSLVGVATALGGWLELAATTAALLWLAGLAMATQHQALRLQFRNHDRLNHDRLAHNCQAQGFRAQDAAHSAALTPRELSSSLDPLGAGVR